MIHLSTLREEERTLEWSSLFSVIEKCTEKEDFLVKKHSSLVALSENAELTKIVLCGHNKYLASFWEAEFIRIIWDRKEIYRVEDTFGQSDWLLVWLSVDKKCFSITNPFDCWIYSNICLWLYNYLFLV